MKRRGDLHIVWPEDVLLEGEKLAALHEKLEVHAQRIDALGIYAASVIPPEATEAAEAAVVDTFQALDRPLGLATTHDIISACWNRDRHYKTSPWLAREQSIVYGALHKLINQGMAVQEDLSMQYTLSPEYLAERAA